MKKYIKSLIIMGLIINIENYIIGLTVNPYKNMQDSLQKDLKSNLEKAKKAAQKLVTHATIVLGNKTYNLDNGFIQLINQGNVQLTVELFTPPHSSWVDKTDYLTLSSKNWKQKFTHSSSNFLNISINLYQKNGAIKTTTFKAPSTIMHNKFKKELPKTLVTIKQP